MSKLGGAAGNVSFGTIMTHDQFWQIIADTCRSDPRSAEECPGPVVDIEGRKNQPLESKDIERC